jgi:hypothetical protein
VQAREWIQVFGGFTGASLHEGEADLLLDLIAMVESAADPVAACATCILSERASLPLAEGLRLARLIAACDDSWDT